MLFAIADIWIINATPLKIIILKKGESVAKILCANPTIVPT